MDTITHSQVQDLITQLPAKKLPIAYRMLTDLRASNTNSTQEVFMLLPIEERRTMMAEQAMKMVEYYEKTASERQTWQTGDFVEY